MSEELYLTDLIDVEILQRIQDSFSDLTGMAALTTDMTGKPVTQGSKFTDFCMKYVRQTEEGKRRCEWCDKFGAEQTQARGRQSTYFCHAGLIDFAAPINVQGKQVGCFIGGQVLTEDADPEKIRQVAETIGADPELLVKASQKVNKLPKRSIDQAAHFLYELAATLSDIAYSKYVTQEASREIEQASQMKSDFLANMSHEIRTPMNAVIGMAEMALRENLPPMARYYINQIKSSGRELLTIINDILDFSKIESGKMDIIPVEYETMSIINDVTNVIVTRLKDKDVELILEVRPDIPRTLLGDNIRIKQVLINIANNATKFTKEGKVEIRVGYERKSDDEIEMRISVKDTGIGIKPKDLNKLFQSFQQVDTKRNRSVEGTGLGLAISRHLLQLMGGDIQVESEYGKGSKFTFTFPQKVVDNDPSIEVPNSKKKAIAGLIRNPYVKAQLAVDCKDFGVNYTDIENMAGFRKFMAMNGGKELFLLISNELFDETWQEFTKRNPKIKVVLLIDFFDDIKCDISNVLVMKKPIYALNLATLLKGGNMMELGQEVQDTDFDFIAPEAEILIVDDNSINLTIAEGLLKPLQMKVQTASSGKEAHLKARRNKFDIIFMDHMMPEMDGIEATKLIRFIPEYKERPIIALTANAVGDVKERFLEAGMNDLVAKPIELRTLIAKVRQWLPPEKILKENGEAHEEQRRVQPQQGQPMRQEKQDQRNQPAGPDLTGLPEEIGDLDIRAAVSMLGSKELYLTILESYYKAIDKKAKVIKETKDNEDIERYTVEVHALKSLSRQIGATELADMAAELEKAGNEKNLTYIRFNTEPLLKKYLAYESVLAPFFPKDEEDVADKAEITADQLKGFFEQLREAADELDLDQMEQIVNEMKGYAYPDNQKELLDRLKEAVESMDTDECEAVLQEWEVVC